MSEARPPVVTLSWGEYESLRRALDEATARAVRCEGVVTQLKFILGEIAKGPLSGAAIMASEAPFSRRAMTTASEWTVARWTLDQAVLDAKENKRAASFIDTLEWLRDNIDRLIAADAERDELQRQADENWWNNRTRSK